MTQKSLHGQYAGFISRLSAFIIDLVIVTIIIIVSTWIVSTILNFFGLSRLFMLPDAEGSLEVTTIQPIALMLAGMSTSAFAIGYFLFSWVLTGQTPGKVIVGLRIVCLDGQPMTFARSIRRMIGYWLAALPFSWDLCGHCLMTVGKVGTINSPTPASYTPGMPIWMSIFWLRPWNDLTKLENLPQDNYQGKQKTSDHSEPPITIANLM